MRKKTLGIFLAGAVFSLCSCVDATYDLVNKEIATDVEIKGNKLSFPLGSLKAFMIDSLVSGVELISTDDNGVYCIKSSDELYIEKNIEPITFSFGSKNISVEKSVTTSSDGQGVAVKSLPVPFDIEKEFAFSNKAPNQFTRIFSCTFMEEMPILMNLKLEGLESIQADAADLDFTITFPPFFKNLKSDDENVSVKNNRVRITKEYLAQNNQGLNIKLYCSEFNFEADTEGGKGLEPQNIGNVTYLSHQSTMKAQGEITLRNNNSGLALSGGSPQIALNVDLTFDNIAVKKVNGVFRDHFYKEENVFATDLGDLAETLKEANGHIRLAAPYIEVVLNSDINVPLKSIEFNMAGKDEEGNTITETEVATKFDLGQKCNSTSGEIIPGTTKILLTSSERLHKEGYQKVETPSLSKWLEHVPDSVAYSVCPILNTSKRANISVDRVISLGATYKAVIPLSFEKLQLAYSDTIPVSLDESFEMFSNAGLKLKMTVTNTLPLGLSLKTTVLDENNSPVSDINISTIAIDPCEEENCTLQDTQNKKRMEIGIESKSLDFRNMKSMKFEVEVFTKDNNEVGFKPTQGIQISDIAIEISGDIKTNLNE